MRTASRAPCPRMASPPRSSARPTTPGNPRKETTMSFKSLLTAVATLAFAAAASAQAPFATLSPPQPTEGGGKIEVIEFFWYGCPHCYTLEPSVEGWLRNVPKDVAFKRVPAVPSEGWGEMARVFYTLETMGVLDQYHAKVF